MRERLFSTVFSDRNSVLATSLFVLPCVTSATISCSRGDRDAVPRPAIAERPARRLQIAGLHGGACELEREPGGVAGGDVVHRDLGEQALRLGAVQHDEPDLAAGPQQ